MKKIKKIILIVTLVFLSLISINLEVYSDTYKTDNGSYNYTVTNEDTRTIVNGVDAIVNTGYTTRSKTNYEQRVNIFTADLSQNSDIKIATWASLNESGTGYVRQDLLSIAKDYEKNNPGWVVLAGINADQYYQYIGTQLGVNGSSYFVPQPYYPMVTNGDNVFVATPYGFSNNFVGFTNDATKSALVKPTTGNKGFYIHIYDNNNNEVGSFPIDGLNCDLGSNKTVVIANYRKDENTFETITRTGDSNIYVVNDADLSFVSSTVAWKSWDEYAVDGFFGKGAISEITSSVTFDKEDNAFAIQTTNEDIKKLLSVGTYIKVQIELGDEFNGIEEAIGFHTIQRQDNKDCNVDNSYNTRAYPRSCFGVDANGKIYLFNCWGDNSSPTTGLYAQEFNALCKKYGIVDAYQMDGGGSVTAVARNEEGILDYAEACIESTHSNGGELTYSGYRYIYSGLFIVMKAPQASIEIGEVNQNDVTINVNTSKLNEYNKAIIRISDENNVTTDYNLDLTKDSNAVKVVNLDANKSYSYELFVQKTGYEEQKTFINGSFNTCKEAPSIISVIAEKVDGGTKVTINYKDDYKSLVKLKGKFGTREVNFNYSNGVATAVIKDSYNVLDMQVVADCVLLDSVTDHQMVNLELKKVSYPADLFFDYAIDEITEMINNLCK